MLRGEIARKREIKVTFKGPLKVVPHKEFLQTIITRLLHQTLNLLDTRFKLKRSFFKLFHSI